MQYIGVDIVEIARIEGAIARWGELFLHRIYTDAELECYRKRSPSLAARFAAKEAIIKALGGLNGGAFREIEVLSDPLGKPVVRLHGQIQKRADSLNLSGFALSLSHCREYAVAFAVAQVE
ncbi:MAG: holo-ACP synthase [Dehalococcoidales bacterium]|nr:holo-ACP synthase [Dehalococcoidales bacterium]